jgi:hypothetical protein
MIDDVRRDVRRAWLAGITNQGVYCVPPDTRDNIIEALDDMRYRPLVGVLIQ